MIPVLADHNVEGQADQLWGTLVARGWLDVVPLRLFRLVDLGLPDNSTDRVVWRFAQAHRMLLLTGNRRQIGPDSLQQTIHDENHAAAFPVITIARLDRIADKRYRERCAERLAEIAFDLASFMGTGRLYIP